VSFLDELRHELRVRTSEEEEEEEEEEGGGE
jgi:hypothetical protein